MKYKELVERVATMPGMDRRSVVYLITRSRARWGEPSPSGLSLVMHRGGTYTATYGDNRDRVVPATDADGRELRFPDEDSACEWAWEIIQRSREPRPQMDPEQRARAVAAGEAVRDRFDRFTRNLDGAIVAYTGHGRQGTPAADADAVLAMSPDVGAALLDSVKDAARVADTVTFAEVAPFDDDLGERLHLRLSTLLPYLGPTAVDALAWRWGYLNLR